MTRRPKERPIAASHLHHDPSATVVSLFWDQARHRSADVAVIEDGRQTTYGALLACATGVTDALLRAGVSAGDTVALLAGRSMLTVAGQLGVMAAGAAFVPLDPRSPGRCHADIVDAAKPTAIVCQPQYAGAARDLAGDTASVVVLGETCDGDHDGLFADRAALTRADDMAYVIFTSGSTGAPKGVMVAHRGVCRLVRGQTYADLGPDQVMLNMAAVGFDAGIGEVYSAILNGGTLAILPDAIPSLDRIGQVIARDGVTIAYITAGLFHIIVDTRPDILAPLRQVFPCGDVLSEPHVRRARQLLPDLRMINGYGPTENTVFTCCHAIDDRWTGGPVPIGTGLAHDRLFVLDDAGRVLPDGQVGQLAVGGAGVALGYLGRPDLTEASFVMLETDGFAGRVYLTGDSVVRDGDGIVMFRGRIDRQVKINGQRVELDSIEHALRADAAVADAAVVTTAKSDGGRRIEAFVVPALTGAATDTLIRAIRSDLAGRVPTAAIPSIFHVRDSFPLSDSGKVDRKRLAADLAQAPAAFSGAPPAQTVAHQIRQTWQDVLGRTIPDDDQTFFDLGGTSLQLMAMHARLQKVIGRRFDIAVLFAAPRVRDLERHLVAAPVTGGATVTDISARRDAMARARFQRKGRA